MENPFNLSDEKLKILLDAFTNWYQNNTEAPNRNYTAEQQENTERIKAKLLNKSYLENTPTKTLVQDILSYSRTLEGPAMIRIGEPRVKEKLETIKRNLLYLINSNEEPITKAARILEGDYKIPIFAKAFWAPIFQAQHPEILPNWNNKSERFLRKVGINVKSSNLSAKEKYNLISDAFIYLNILDPKQTFYHINHLMHYGTEIDEGVKLIAELTGDTGDTIPTSDRTQQIEKWRNEHISEKRLAIREEAYQKAQALLESKVGNLNEAELREFFQTINLDYWNDKITHARFQMAYVGKNVKELVNQIDTVNNWISLIWKAPEIELKDLLDKFYKDKPIKNAGSAFPSLILFFRNQNRFNLCFGLMEDGLNNLTGFQEKNYSGDYYFNYNSKVNEFKSEYDLLPQEVDIILSIAGKPVKDSPFSKKTFNLLQGLHEDPKRDYYIKNKDDFKEYLEEPFQNIFQKVASKFENQIDSLLETNKDLFSRILKNDWGKGGAWDYYWGAFHPKGSKRIEDAQLFAMINHEIFEFGFYVGEYGVEQRKRFLLNCQKNNLSLQNILSESLSDPQFIFGEWDKKLEKGVVPSQLKDLTWVEWLANPEEKGIQVSKILLKDELLALDEEGLADQIYNAFCKLFPLILLTIFDNPLPAIGEYLDINGKPDNPQPSYSLMEFSNDTGVELEQLESWIRAIDRKGQAIFYGPPGTGKTFIAEHIARHLIGGGNGFYDIVQFHPAYAYEDFVQGIRPKAKENGQLDYPIVPGRFLEFCKKARRSEDISVLIIDEINRANLSRVFGELMYLLEYREKDVPLANGGQFSIPKNVRIIGTMNTADRSIALVDHALRRRFAFLALYPNYEILKKYHSKTGFNVDPLIKVLQTLNHQIGDKHYEVGITFFLKEDIFKQIQDIWQMEIEPYLEEYFFDQADKVEKFRWISIGTEILK